MENTDMKKTYINPTMDVVELNMAQQLLAGSAARFDDLGGGEVNLVDDDPDDGAALGRELFDEDFI